MHKTNTVDYAVVYEGDIGWSLNDAKTIHLKRGDVVVQNGTRTRGETKAQSPLRCCSF